MNVDECGLVRLCASGEGGCARMQLRARVCRTGVVLAGATPSKANGSTGGLSLNNSHFNIRLLRVGGWVVEGTAAVGWWHAWAGMYRRLVGFLPDLSVVQKRIAVAISE